LRKTVEKKDNQTPDLQHGRLHQLKSSWIKNSLVLFPVIAAMALAGYYLYLDYEQTSSPSQEGSQQEIIGEVTFTNNNVKRKLGDSALWEPLEKKSSLFAKDAIRTGSDSYATIKFNDGNLLEVNENSLIVLDKNTDKLSVDFKVGDIASRGQQKGLEIKVNDAVVQTDSADLKLTAAADRAAQIVVEKGKATVTGRDKKKVDIGQSQRGALTATGETSVSQLTVILKSPEPRTEIKTPLPEIQQQFMWEVTKPEITEERLEISRSARFEEKKTKLYKAHQSLTVPIKQGIQYWRVGWDTGGGKYDYSETRRVIVQTDRSLELVFPENEMQFQFEPGESQIEFRWTSQNKAATSFILEIAESVDFTKLRASQSIKEGASSWVEKDLGSGNYYWRVKALGEKNKPVAESSIRTFSVKVSLPRLPELESPLADGTWETARPVEFKWKVTPKAQTYRILISRDLAQKEVLKTETRKDPVFFYRWKQPTTLFWSVAALDAAGALVGQSEVRKLTISPKLASSGILLVSPKNKSEVIRDKKKEMDPIIFQWKPTRRMPGPYQFLISKDSEFKTAVKKDDITGLSFQLRLNEPGIYYWKVISHGKAKTPSTAMPSAIPNASPAVSPPVATAPSPLPDGQSNEWSEVSQFELKINNNILPPQLVEPLNKANIVNVEPSPVVFQWKAVEGAAQYRILIEKRDPQTEETTPVADKMVTETKFESPILQEGEYVWSVASVDSQGVIGIQSKPRTFDINLQEELSAPQLKAPVVK